MTFEFSGEAIEWRGPAPFVFVAIPPEIATEIKSIAAMATYGWGCIPVRGELGNTTFTTSLFPRQGIYFVPIKVAVQRAESVHLGDVVSVRIEINLNPR